MKDKFDLAKGKDPKEKTKALLKEYLENDSLTYRKYRDFLLDISKAEGEVKIE